MAKIKRDKMSECFQCIHRRSIPGDAHTRCVNPDPSMKGNPHAVAEGWFMYPFNFDPTWKMKDCSNFEATQ